jgi:hypothetical protein
MLRQSILASIVIAAGTLSFANQSFANPATGDVQFNTKVPGECTFTNAKVGKITKYSSNLLTSDPGDGKGGISGSINLSCTGAAVLSVADPVQLSGPTTTSTNAAFVYTTAGNVVSPSGAPLGLGLERIQVLAYLLTSPNKISE